MTVITNIEDLRVLARRRAIFFSALPDASRYHRRAVRSRGEAPCP